MTEFAARGGWWVAAQVPLLAVAIALPLWTAHASGTPSHPVQWLGLALTAGGLLLALAGVLTLGRALTPYPRPRDSARLRTHGVYRWVRHPVYSGLLVGAFGWALVWLSVAGVAYALALGVFFDRKARREERWLRERFPEYAEYERRVRRLIPGIY
jgi:protein-S-isoprenylcysteine O-methyltransferase Ste14